MRIRGRFLLATLILMVFLTIDAAFLIVGEYELFFVFLASNAFFFLLLYLYVRRLQPRYPMVPPTLDADAYFPRTQIPRPIHEDLREHPKFFDERKRDELVAAVIDVEIRTLRKIIPKEIRHQQV